MTDGTPLVSDAGRLATLHSYAILDTPPETEFDDLAALAAQVCRTPIAMISFLDRQRLWSKAAQGIGIRELPLVAPLCACALQQGSVFVVPDARADERFRAIPLVSPDDGIRFFAAAPLQSPNGHMLGTLCVLDRQPRRLTARQVQALAVIGRLVMTQLEMRRQARETAQSNMALLGILEDERRAEAAVREREEFNRAVLNSMLAHIVVVDRSGRIVAVNDAWQRFVLEHGVGGDGPALLGVGRDYLDICHASSSFRPADAQAVTHGLQSVLLGERRSFTMEYPWSGPQGERWFLMVVTPLRTSGGGAAISHVEITERRRAEEELRISNQRFHLVARATSDAVRDWDLAADAVWWSEGIETLFGLRREQLKSGSGSWTDNIHPDDRERILTDLRSAVAAGEEAWAGHYRFRRGDGSYAQVTDHARVIRDAHGTAIRMVGGITDVTDRVALEDRLRQSQRLEAIGQLTGGVAHDFNNLLTVILGNAALLAEELAGDATRQALSSMICSAATKCADLTRRLLAFARKQALNPQAVDINLMVGEMDALLRRTLGEHIEIIIKRCPDLWGAMVDAAQLEGALLNLCLNARDAMADGGQLLIETSNAYIDEDHAARHVDLKVGEYIRLAVSDQGTGIAPENLGRVFEPFFTTKDKAKGTGLGLAMVYGFVKQSGGHIEIYSELGCGTTVSVYLPRSDAAAQPSAPPSTAPAAVHGGETILLVEDDDLVRRFASGQLVSLGYRVLEASNGQQALDIVSSRADIDLLFTDLIMPGKLNGRQLADESTRLRPRIKVLFTSGYTEDAAFQYGHLEHGMQLLTKPYRRQDLGARIRALLDLAPLAH